MTGIERTKRLLSHQRTDRIGLYEHFWNDTAKTWREQGHMGENDSFARVFGFDIDECWAFTMTADLDFKNIIIAETDETITAKDGNGAILRRHKLHDTTPEHIDFTVKCQRDWDEHIKPVLKFDTRRINFEGYRKKKRECMQDNRFFCWGGVPVFELMHPVCGHEHMLVGMAMEPDWIRDMCKTYMDLNIALLQELFSKEGRPDGFFVYEDMGFKQRPFMSPAMYRELIMPYHRQLCDFAHSMGIPVIMHSCGFIEPLLPHMVEAGIDCLQVIEVKAGMDLLRIHRNFGEKIALMGGIDVRELISNDRGRIEAELSAKIPVVKQGFSFFLHTDHSVPKDVEFETYRWFIERGLELGTYD